MWRLNRSPSRPCVTGLVNRDLGQTAHEAIDLTMRRSALRIMVQQMEETSPPQRQEALSGVSFAQYDKVLRQSVRAATQLLYSVTKRVRKTAVLVPYIFGRYVW